MMQLDEYKALWVGVIMQAIADLHDTSKVERAKARAWLTAKDSTFVDICDTLKLNIGMIRRVILK
jgi:hypothetical protein